MRNLGRLTRLGGFSLTEGSNPDQIGKYAVSYTHLDVYKRQAMISSTVEL